MNDNSKNILQNFAENLKGLRKQAGINQTQLADIIGLKRNTISNYEGAHMYPSFQAIIKIAQYFKVGLDDLISLKEVIKNDNSLKLKGLHDASISDLYNEIRRLEREKGQLEGKLQMSQDRIRVLEAELEKLRETIRAMKAQGNNYRQSG